MLRHKMLSSIRKVANWAETFYLGHLDPIAIGVNHTASHHAKEPHRAPAVQALPCRLLLYTQEREREREREREKKERNEDC